MKRTLSFLFKHTDKKWKYKLLLLVICNLLLAATAMMEPEILRLGVDALERRSIVLLKQTAVMVVIFVPLHIGFQAAVSLCNTSVKTTGQYNLLQHLFDEFAETQKTSMDRYQFGDISTIFIDNTDKCMTSSIEAITNFCAGLSTVVIAAIYMFIVEWRLTIVLLTYYFIVRAILAFLTHQVKKKTSTTIAAEQQATNLLTSFLTNMISIRVSGNQSFFSERFKKAETTVMKKNFTRFMWSSGQQDFVWMAAKVAEYLILYGFGVLVLKDIPLVIFFSFIFANDIFNNGVQQFASFLNERAQAEAYILSIEGFRQNQIFEPTDKSPLPTSDFVIRFEEVSFNYGERRILDKISFTIPHGAKVLVKGKNGQGKSTLLKLLCGLYRPTAGKIWYGGTDTTTKHICSLSQCYAYVSQQSDILDGSVCENITLSEQYDAFKLKGILDALQLSSCQSVSPELLSMGEKQRLNVARAFYKEAPVFVVADEIFSNIDAANRDRVLEEFMKRFKNCTVFMITHEKLEYPFDRVLTVEHGSVLEEWL